MRTPMLNGLGQALRWLRDRQNKKQYQVAEAAGITKGMLSAYETGRQRPSLETLEKILSTLGCDLNDLHNSIQIINGRPEQMKRKGEGAGGEEPSPGVSADRMEPARSTVQRILGRRDPLPVEEERALGEMLDGFHRLLRYFHDSLAEATRRPEPKRENDEDR